MMRTILLITCAIAAVVSGPAPRAAAADKPLAVYFIDVEGGQATLVVSPSGESMLVDTGYPGSNDRDVGRILTAAKQAGVSRIDYLVITHYHTDHVGNAPALAAKIPIGTFVDHGPTVEPGTKAIYDAYVEARKAGRHLQVKPGDKIPIAGLDVTVVSSAGDVLSKALAGAGAPNTLCGEFQPKEADPTENAQSLGIVIAYGRFRMLDLGDLTWNKEHDLVCPENRIGRVCVYLTTHHGLAASGAPVIVQGVMPRVAVLFYGAKKGGSAECWSVILISPGVVYFCELH
jgi:competence protein ComEC